MSDPSHCPPPCPAWGLEPQTALQVTCQWSAGSGSRCGTEHLQSWPRIQWEKPHFSFHFLLTALGFLTLTSSHSAESLFTHLLLLQPCNLCPDVRVAGTGGAQERQEGSVLILSSGDYEEDLNMDSILMGPFQLSVVYDSVKCCSNRRHVHSLWILLVPRGERRSRILACMTSGLRVCGTSATP